jgi:hypothetical protein
MGILLTTIALTIQGCTTPGRPAAPQPVAAEPIVKPPATGSLGVPFGTVVEIRATVIAGRELQSKALVSRYLLRVTEMNGRPLPTPQTMEFRVPGFVRVALASGNFDLYELKNGKPTGSLTGEQIAELEKGYVGKQVRLAAYETGGYTGVPDNLPEDVPTWQDYGFHFRSYLIVLAERPLQAEQPAATQPTH